MMRSFGESLKRDICAKSLGWFAHYRRGYKMKQQELIESITDFIIEIATIINPRDTECIEDSWHEIHRKVEAIVEAFAQNAH